MIAAIAVSPRGQLLATGSWDKTIQLWDLATGAWRKTWTGHRGQVLCLDFSPDGETLVSGSADTSVKLWNVDRGEVTRTLEGHSSAVHDVAFSPDGRIVASASGDRTVRLWYLDWTKRTETLPHDSPVTSLAFAPDGCTLASASGNRVRLWQTRSQVITAELERLVSLERNAQGICQADADQRRRLFDRLKDYLTQRASRGLRQRDIILAVSTAQRLRQGAKHEAAADLLHELAETLTQAGSQDEVLSELAESWERCARSLRLLGRPAPSPRNPTGWAGG
jgi:predicted NACHT family NTPase